MLKSWAEGRSDVTVSCFPDGDALIRVHKTTAFDIVFLDVMMPILNGIEVAREIRLADKNVKLVFLTSSPDFAVESYAVKASNYLLKPVDPAKLFLCLDELEAEARAAARMIAVKGVRKVHHVSVASIEFLEGRGKHTALTLSDGEIVESTEPLYVLEGKLSLDDGFFRYHRSYVVNVNYIGTYASDEVTMRSGARIPVSRGCRAEFKEAYFSVIFGNDGDGAW